MAGIKGGQNGTLCLQSRGPHLNFNFQLKFPTTIYVYEYTVNAADIIYIQMWRIFQKYLLSWNNFTRINAIKLKERTCSILQYLQDPDDDYLEKTRKYLAIKDNPTRAISIIQFQRCRKKFLI